MFLVLSLALVSFSYPTLEMPYYHLRCSITTPEDAGMRITAVNIASGSEAAQPAQFRLYLDQQPMKEPIIPQGAEAMILVRCDWEAGKEYTVSLECEELEQSENQEPETLVTTAMAPDQGGYWNMDWQNYLPIVVQEKQGVARQSEPVDVSLAIPSAEVTDLVKELRIVEVDESGKHTEIPSQVYAVEPYTPTVRGAPEATIRFNVVFLADVPAYGSKTYLAFYGNPDAPAPQYETDLTVSGEGVGLTWENSKAMYKFQETSGQLQQVFVKMGVEQLLKHGDAAMHWNPDCYSQPRTWAHTYSWVYPDTVSMSEIRGPLFVQMTRWGPLQPDMPEVFASVTYRLYAHNPQLYMSSLMEVVEDIPVLAIRNDEMVLDTDLVSHVAWQELSGEVVAGLLAPETAGAKPFWEGPHDLDLPWVCLYHPEGGYGYGSIRLEASCAQKFGKPFKSSHAGTYIISMPDYHSYWFRTYALDEYMLPLENGTIYTETNAYLPFKTGEGDQVLRPIQEAAKRLRNPLEVRVEKGGYL